MPRRREHHAHDRARHRQHEVLDNQQPDDPRPRRTEREAHGDLAAPRDAAHQHEPGDVRARDHQHQQPHALQDDAASAACRSARRSETARIARLSAAGRRRSAADRSRQRGPERVRLDGRVRQRRARSQVALRIDDSRAPIGEDSRRRRLLAAKRDAERAAPSSPG